MATYGVYSGGTVIAAFAAPLSVISNVPVFTSDTLSLKRRTARRSSAQRWEVSSNLESLSAGANTLHAFLVSKGHFGAFQIVMPQNYGAILKRTAAAGGTASGAAGATQLTASFSGLIPAGTFVRFSSHSKVYMVTSDSTGGTLNVFPELRIATSGTFTYRDDVLMECLLDTSSVVGMSYTDGILMNNGTLKFIESL